MEYREQLKYIKSHRIVEEPEKKRDRRELDNRPVRRKKRRKPVISKFDKNLWKLLFLTSIIFMGAALLLGVFPEIYLIIMVLLLFIILFSVKLLQKKALRSNKRKPKGRGIAIICSCFLMIASFYMVKMNFAISKISVGTVETTDVSKEAFHVYVSGIDVFGELTTQSRSDVNLVATVNPEVHKILLTTTPRDYYVTIPGVSGEQKDKLTHAGIYGVETSMATLENLYGIDIPFYFRVNFTSVIEIVDALGGIDVESEIAFTTGEDSGVVMDIHEGNNHLTGKEALAFVRERKAFIDGDNQRGKNQQALMTAMIRKAFSPMIVFQMSDVIDGVVGNAETNMTEGQIKSLIRKQLYDLKGWNIESVAASGDDSGKQYCYSYSAAPLYVTVPDTVVVDEIKRKMGEIIEETM